MGQCKQLEKLDFSHNKLGKDNAWNGLAELIQADSHCIYELSALIWFTESCVLIPSADITDTQVPISVLQQLLMITEGNVAVLAAENNLYAFY